MDNDQAIIISLLFIAGIVTVAFVFAILEHPEKELKKIEQFKEYDCERMVFFTGKLQKEAYYNIYKEKCL